MTGTISPIRAPEPHSPDQGTLFEMPVDTTFAQAGRQGGVTLRVELSRTPRQKCAACGRRRVCYFISVGGLITGAEMCAPCHGIR